MSESAPTSPGRTRAWTRRADWLYICLLTALVASVVAGLANILYSTGLVATVQDHPLYFTDFVKYYISSQLLITGHAAAVYEPEAYLQSFKAIFGAGHSPGLSFIQQYPPTFFLIVLPLALMPIGTACGAWLMVSSIASLAGLLLAGSSNRLRGWQVIPVWLGLMAALPALRGLLLGQVSFFQLFFIGLFWWSLSRRQDVTAGVSLALTLVKPQFTLFLILPVLAGKRWTALLSAAAAEALLLAASGVLVGWTDLLRYPSVLLRADSQPDTGSLFPLGLVSLHGPLSFLFSPAAGQWISLVIFLASIILLFRLWVRAYESGEQARRWAMAITVVAGLVVSLHAHLYECIYLALPVVLTLPGLSVTDSLKLKPMPLKAWALVLLFYPLLSWCIFFVTAGNALFTTYMFTAINVLLLGLGLMCFKIDQFQPPPGNTA